MATKLTKKQKGFVKDYALTENGTEAVMNHYDVKDNIVAKSIASENLTKPYIVEAIDEIKKTVAESLTEELLLQVHLEGLNATKLSGTGGMRIGMTADGEVSEVNHSDLEVPDYAVRHKYLDSAYKLKGSYAPEKSVTATIDLTPTHNSDTEDLAKQYEEALKLKILNERREN